VTQLVASVALALVSVALVSVARVSVAMKSQPSTPALMPVR
jgi:hypothetical protein